MDYQNNNPARQGSGKRFDVGNIIGDAFSLATISVAMGGWFIAFISSIISSAGDEGYPKFAWWALCYMFCLIVGIVVAVLMDCVYTYHVGIVGFVSAALVFNTSAINTLIYSPYAANEAAAAGFILLSMVNIFWIFYYGSQPNAAHRQTIDSFALHKDRAPSRNSRHMTQSQTYNPRPETHSSQQPTMYNSAQLAGFETSSPVTGYPGGATGASKRNSQTGFPQPGQHEGFAGQQTQQINQPTIHNPSASTTAPSGTTETPLQPNEYPYRAKAIYSYEANPDDANEISFSKHEILDVSDVSGRWWQAKKENGETGIAPSNYLILL